jgi:hypothetical protein
VDTQYISSKLGRYFSDLSRQYYGVQGWQGKVYSRGSLLVINAPASSAISGKYYQFAMNTNTNAWCRFLGMDGICFAVMGGSIFFSTYDGRVVQADTGTTDNGASILCDCRQAFTNFDDGHGLGDADKLFHFGTFIMSSSSSQTISGQLDVNFESDPPAYIGAITNFGATWDIAVWDVDQWADEATIQNIMATFGKIGYTASLWMRCTVNGSPIKWYATRLTFEKTNGVVFL